MNTDIFFQLLRYSIGASDVFPQGITPEEWVKMYEMAQQKSLLGVLFYGIQRQAQSNLSRNLLLRWYAASEQIRGENEKTSRVAVRVCDGFPKDGFKACVLKGQGNTLYYPDLYIRTSGDVDVWVEGGGEKVLAFVRKKGDISPPERRLQRLHVHRQ